MRGGTYGDAVLYSRWCPGFRLGPLAVTVSFYSHFYIVYMACLSVDLSLSGQVCAGDFPFPALPNRGLVRRTNLKSRKFQALLQK